MKKFRAWDKHLNKWSNPNDMAEKNYKNREIVRHDSEDSKLHVISHDDFIWMQYTGLKDKNGKEIYEGDITQHGVIVFENYGFCVELAPKDGMKQVESIAVYMSDLEVIGNIYEPKLSSDNLEIIEN